MLGAIWGSADQKNEAVGLLRQGLDRIGSRTSALRGYERVELIAAAHSWTGVVSFGSVTGSAPPGTDWDSPAGGINLSD